MNIGTGIQLFTWVMVSSVADRQIIHNNLTLVFTISDIGKFMSFKKYYFSTHRSASYQFLYSNQIIRLIYSLQKEDDRNENNSEIRITLFRKVESDFSVWQPCSYDCIPFSPFENWNIKSNIYALTLDHLSKIMEIFIPSRLSVMWLQLRQTIWMLNEIREFFNSNFSWIFPLYNRFKNHLYFVNNLCCMCRVFFVILCVK